MSSTPPDVAAPPAQASSDPSTEHQSTQPALESKGKEVVSDVAHNVTDDNETADTAEKTAMEVPDTAVDKDVVGASTEAMDTSSTSNASQGQVPASSSLQLAASSLRTEKAEATETTTATDEHEKDKGSVSTTLTTPPAQTPPQSRSSKRKAHKSSSTEGPPEKRAARVEGNGAQKKSSTTPRSKRSFLSKLMRKLVPCVGPSRGHPIDIVAVDDSAGASEQKQSPPALHRETEPLSANGAPRDQATTAPPKDDSKKESIDTPPATQNTVTTIAQLSPAVDNVEPLPNKGTVPPVEPEAVTSGGVQPPGSTGDAHGHPPTHAARESGEESEGTSYTDDEGDEVGVDEEEEDTLILNGGVGIPIGPVSDICVSLI
jgi:RNA polymerase II subunit A small phosphatase-like protein